MRCPSVWSLVVASSMLVAPGARAQPTDAAPLPTVVLPGDEPPPRRLPPPPSAVPPPPSTPAVPVQPPAAAPLPGATSPASPAVKPVAPAATPPASVTPSPPPPFQQATPSPAAQPQPTPKLPVVTEQPTAKPAVKPTAACPEAPPCQDAAAGEAKVKVGMFPPVVSLAQFLGFAGAQWSCALMTWGCVAVPMPVTGLLAILGAILFAPGLAGATAVVLGDYLSGERHPMLAGLISSYATMWVVALVTVLVDLALTVALYLSAKPFFDSLAGYGADMVRGQGIRILSQEQSDKLLGQAKTGGTALVVVAALMGVATVAGLAGLALLPPATTTLLLTLLRREQDEKTRFPHIVRRGLVPDDDLVVSSVARVGLPRPMGY